MPEDKREREEPQDGQGGPPPAELSAEELEAQQAAELPDREAMSLINANIAAPINASIAANILSDNASATSHAVQNTPIDQNSI